MVRTTEGVNDMERLTERIKGYSPFGWEGGVFLKGKKPTENCPSVFCKKGKTCTHNENRTCPLLKALDRLADLEDKLERGELVEVVECGKCKYSEHDLYKELNITDVHGLPTNQTTMNEYLLRKE
jgi:Zn ribbon nucleic-acid-binding protein